MSKEKETWAENRKSLHKETEKEEKRVLSRARKRIHAKSAALKLALLGLLLTAADKAGRIEYRRTQERASADIIANANLQASEYNRTHPAAPVPALPPTASRADVADLLAVLALKGMAQDAGDIISPHIGETAKRAYTQTLKFTTGTFDAMTPYLTKTTEDWARQQSLDVYGILETTADRNGEKMKQILKQGYARGTSYEHLVEESVAKIQGLEEQGAYRCIYTEGTRVMAEASAQAVIDKGYKKYRLSTVGDSKVCEICKGLEEKVFTFEDREPGVNFPPLHPMCRCTFYVVTDAAEEADERRE